MSDSSWSALTLFDLHRLRSTPNPEPRTSNPKLPYLNTPSALICGISGQDGAYLAQLLLSKGYRVVGTSRDAQGNSFSNLKRLGIKEEVNLISMDVEDFRSVLLGIKKSKPEEIYFLSGQSSVSLSFEQPAETIQSFTVGVLNVLEAVKMMDYRIKVYHAGSSEAFGDTLGVAATEETPFQPRSPYALAKASATWLVNNYREAYQLFACTGILFNHESPLRGREFVTRKITDSVAKIKLGKLSVVELGNLDAKRDWGFAKEYVEGMWRMLQADEPDTFVLATNRTETVRDFVSMAFKGAGITVDFKGETENETAVDVATGRTVMRVNPKFYRPAEVELLIGDPARAKEKLDWAPTTTLEELCQMMVEADLRRNQAGFSF